MATFRSRQRASQRRDGKREVPASQPESAQKPGSSTKPSAKKTDKPRNPAGKPQSPAVAGKPSARPAPPARKAPTPTDRPASRPAPAMPSDAPRRQAPQASAEPVAPVEPPRKATTGKPLRGLIKPASEAALPSDRPAATPNRPDPATSADAPRRHAPQASQPPRISGETASPNVAPPRVAGSKPLRGLIKPASEVATPVDRQEQATPEAAPPSSTDTPRRRPTTPTRTAEKPAAPAAAPALRLPNRHAPEQRRGLPATETMPTERPAFERRTAEPRQRPGAPAHMALFASCPRGLEPVLHQELQRLGADEIAPVDGGIGFSGSLELLMRVNLESRVASRVLLRLARGVYRDEREINALAMQVDWPRYFDVSRTIKVKTDGIGARVKSLDYVSLTVKDAVCDRFRQAQLGRPSVDTRAPDVRIQVFLAPDEASIYLDSSGEALFKRGWRHESGEAPLRENLAAGILLLAGYTGAEPLLDPMCGSGTFLVEAADIAHNRAPGRARSFAFEKWRIFDPALWTHLRNAARDAEKPAGPLPIRGSDHDARMVAIARANLERAGHGGQIEVEQCELFECRPHAQQGLIVTNPPYGVRLEEQDTLAAFYPPLGDWLKQYFAGWTAHLFTGDLRLPKLIRLTIKRRIPLHNGAIDCRLFVLPLIAGSARTEKKTPT
jgi:putative N6-adenine-specific DNA methylase